MKKMMLLRSLAILCFSVTLISCSSEDTNEVDTTETKITLNTYTHSAFELELLDLINQDRVNKGLNALTIISEISYVASTHDDYMITSGTISHDNFEDRANKLRNGVDAIIVSENVASGFNTSAGVLAAWNASPAHKANLEGNHSHFGLAVKADTEGKKYYTLLFIKK